MRNAWLGGGIIALLLTAIVILKRHQDPKIAEQHSATSFPVARQYGMDAARGHEDTTDRVRKKSILSEWFSLVAWIQGPPPPPPEEIRSRLRELRNTWARLDPDLLAEILSELLDARENTPTGLPFEVGPQGLLAGWPDLRTYLVDSLGMTTPEAALEIARPLLKKTDSPSEYAVGIRCLVRCHGSGVPSEELMSCFGTLLARKEWQRDAATLEALDLARYLGNRDAASALLRWEGNHQAREMALHEFAAEYPETLLTVLAEQAVDLNSPQSLSLLARADPSEENQARMIDLFIRNPSIPKEHRESFLSLYPLRSMTTGYRLYRGNPSPYDEMHIRQSDAAALAQADSWLRDPSLQDLHPALQKWKNRLIEWQSSPEE